MNTYTYTVLFEYFKDEDAEGYNVVVPALPGCCTWGDDLQHAKEMAHDAIRAYIESLIKDGLRVPEDIAGPDLVRIEELSLAI